MYTADKSNWLNPDIEYLLNAEIYEYDIKSAGMSLIKQFRLLDQTTIDRLSHLEKFAATVEIGKLQRSFPEFSRALLDRFREMREAFIGANTLTDQRIISVKKDAIFTIGQCDRLEFGQVIFVPKNTYSSYLRFPSNSNIELYVANNDLDVKGISDVSLARHRLYMMPFISKVINQLEAKNSSVRRYLRQFIGRYRNMELDEGYYLEFNNRSATVDPVFNHSHVITPLVQLTLKELS